MSPRAQCAAGSLAHLPNPPLAMTWPITYLSLEHDTSRKRCSAVEFIASAPRSSSKENCRELIRHFLHSFSLEVDDWTGEDDEQMTPWARAGGARARRMECRECEGLWVCNDDIQIQVGCAVRFFASFAGRTAVGQPPIIMIELQTLYISHTKFEVKKYTK